MSNGCKCSGCNTQRYYDGVHAEKESSLGHFTQFVEGLMVPPKIGSGYQLTLSGPATEDGYVIRFNANITIFEFFNLYSEYVNSNIELDFPGEEEF